MKVMLKYKDEANDELTTSMKITLPKSWVSGPNMKLKQTFVEHFNKKHPEHALAMEETHLLLGGRQLKEDDIVEASVKPDAEILIKKGKYAGEQANPTTASVATSADAGKQLKTCKRFGCNKKYDPDVVDPEGCCHHKKPPVFHETRKYWWVFFFLSRAQWSSRLTATRMQGVLPRQGGVGLGVVSENKGVYGGAGAYGRGRDQQTSIHRGTHARLRREGTNR